jgi:anti-sigma factor RsiW
MTTLHILDDHLEAYSLGRLAAAATAPAEDHLLGCADCRDRLARWDEYIRAMRAACQTFRDRPLKRAAGLSPD